MSTNSSLTFFLGLFPWFLLHDWPATPGWSTSHAAQWSRSLTELTDGFSDSAWRRPSIQVRNKDSWSCRLKICPAFISKPSVQLFGWKTCPLWCHQADSILTESSTSSVSHPRFCPFPNISISVFAEGWKSRVFLLGGYKQIAKHAVSWWSVVCWEANK